MKIRLRTNLGSNRIECQADWTLQQLIEEIISQLNIARNTNVAVSFDLEGSNPLNPSDAKVSSLGLTDGIQVFLVGKYEKKTVEKSYVDVDGVVVPSGTTLVRVDAANVVESEPSLPEHPVTTTENSKEVKAIQEISESAIPPITSVEAQSENTEVDRYFGGEYRDYEEQNFNSWEDDGVRVPDESQQMQLINDAEFSAAFVDNVSPFNGILSCLSDKDCSRKMCSNCESMKSLWWMRD